MRKVLAVLIVTATMIGFMVLPAFASIDIGTVYTGQDFSGSSLTFTRSSGCTVDDPVKEVAYVGDFMNDRIFSSRILANNCSSVKFFEHANFGGQWFSCDDLCNGTQGDWGIGVSSIKYRRNGG